MSSADRSDWLHALSAEALQHVAEQLREAGARPFGIGHVGRVI